MPIIFNKKSNCYSIAGIIINPGANVISQDLFNSLKTHDLFNKLLKTDCFKVLNNKKEVRKEVEKVIPKGVSQDVKKKILDSTKTNEVEGNFDDSQVGNSTPSNSINAKEIVDNIGYDNLVDNQKLNLDKEQKEAINKRCKELGINFAMLKSYKSRLDSIIEKETETNSEEGNSEEEGTE